MGEDTAGVLFTKVSYNSLFYLSRRSLLVLGLQGTSGQGRLERPGRRDQVLPDLRPRLLSTAAGRRSLGVGRRRARRGHTRAWP